MRTKRLLLAVILTLTMICGTASATTTEATVAFVDGVLEFGELDVTNGGMNIDFGSHTLPTNTVSYEAVDGEHNLVVIDAVSSLDNWIVTGSLSVFRKNETGNPIEFDGTIDFTDSEGEVSVTSGGGAVDFMTRQNTATGEFIRTWAEEEIELSILKDEALKVNTPSSYTATITWTLNVDGGMD